jgi:endonuclease-3
MADAEKIMALLLRTYPHPTLALNYSNPLELLIAVILSAQCTDARVNRVTAELFKKYRSARDFAQASPATLEQEIRPTGFYRNKTQLVIGCCQRLADAYHGELPRTLDELTTLPGVGRKTANMVLGNAFGVPGIAVDTHVLRVSNRLGLVGSQNVDKVEKALMEQLPKERWVGFTNALILHGRETCTARNPACGRCPLFDVCEWPDKGRYAGQTPR